MPGQDYAMARYYSASSGSFLSPDPGGVKTATPSSPTTWNRYLYASGDLINRIDPFGRDDCDPDDVCCDPDEGCDEPCADFLGEGCGEPPPLPPDPGPSPSPGAAPPTCEQLLTNAISGFLSGKGSPLANDTSDIVSVGQQDNIDPTLIAAIAIAENGTAQNNPFAVGPNGTAKFGSLTDAITAVGAQLKKQIYKWGETTVSALWSGNGHIVNPKRPWIVIQFPAYCVGTGNNAAAIAAAVAGCQNTGNTIAGFMQKIGQQATVGGDPNYLAFPCKDGEDE